MYIYRERESSDTKLKLQANDHNIIYKKVQVNLYNKMIISQFFDILYMAIDILFSKINC